MIVVVIGLFCLLFGTFVGYQIGSAPSVPPPPKCRAVLASGEQCVYDAGHDGYHRTRLSAPGGYGYNGQEYCWEAPADSVYPVVVRWRSE